MSKNIVLAVDAASQDPARHVRAAAASGLIQGLPRRRVNDGDRAG
jgi:hypothetical protein